MVVSRIGIFGPVARGEQTEASDIGSPHPDSPGRSDSSPSSSSRSISHVARAPAESVIRDRVAAGVAYALAGGGAAHLR